MEEQHSDKIEGSNVILDIDKKYIPRIMIRHLDMNVTQNLNFPFQSRSVGSLYPIHNYVAEELGL